MNTNTAATITFSCGGPATVIITQTGGPTLVHMPEHNGPVIDGVVGNDAPATDQRGQLRPGLLGYDLGAVERQLDDSDLAPRLYLALLRR